MLVINESFPQVPIMFSLGKIIIYMYFTSNLGELFKYYKP